MKTLHLTLALALAPLSSVAETTQPYAGLDGRDIAALTEDRIAGLRAGAGLGYALSAELNGWPGPLHVLEIAEELALSPEVRAEVEAIRAAMLAETIPLGEALIAAEAEVDAVFAAPAPSAADVAAATSRAAEIEGRLRAAHLAAHLRTTPLLTRHQRMLYAEARGYAAEDAGPGHVGHGGAH